MRKFTKKISLFLTVILFFTITAFAQNAPVTTIGSLTTTVGSAVAVPITVDNFTDVGAITLRLYYNPTQLTFVSTNNVNSALAANMTIANNAANPSNPYIAVVWSDINGATLANGSMLFNANFTFNAGPATIFFDNVGASGSYCEYANSVGDVMLDEPTASYYIDGVISGQATCTMTAFAGDDQSIISGGSALLSGAAMGGVEPYSYLWTPATGLDDSQLQKPTASPVVTTTYTVIATDINGCSATDDVIVTVTQPCNFTIDLGPDKTICIGASVEFTATGGVSYLWNNGYDGSLLIVTPALSSTYSVTATDANGCTATDEVLVTVYQAPVADAGPDQTITTGGSTTIGTSGFAMYYWSPSTGLSDAYAATPVASPVVTTTYTLTVSNIFGCAATDDVTVIVAQCSLIANAGMDQNIYVGQSATLFAEVFGGTLYSYIWSTQESTQSITVSPTLTQSYFVTVTDISGCTATDDVTVNVTAAPCTMTVNAGQDQSITAGQSAYIFAEVAGGTAPYFYMWSNDASTTSISVSPTVTADYWVAVSDINGCTATDFITVTVIECTLTADAGPDQTIYIGQSATLSVSSTGFYYSWSNQETTESITVSPTATTTYSVTVMGANFCTATDEVTVTVLPCTMTADAGMDQNITVGQSATLAVTVTGGAAPYYYYWTNDAGFTESVTVSPVTTQNYFVIVSDVNGCTATDDVYVILPSTVPNTGLTSVYNGSTVNTLAKYVYCTHVSGATNFEWEFTATDFSFTKMKGNGNTGFYLAWVTGIEFGNTYNVRVRAYKNGVWGNYSTTGQITIGALPTTQVRADYCGITVTTLNKYLYCDIVAGASDYEWKFENAASNYSFTKTRGIVSASMLLSGITGLMYGTTYDVSVRAKVGTQWGGFGAVCQVTTPGITTTKVRAEYCGITATTMNKAIYCDAKTGATDYEWKFVDAESGFSFTKLRGSSNTGFYICWVTGIEYGKTYDVTVKVKIGTQWSNYGPACQISTPSPAKNQETIANNNLVSKGIEMTLSPNPVRKGNSFAVSLQSEENINGTSVNIYNIIGQIVYTQKINVDANNYTLNIDQNSKFTSGLFIIQTEMNGEVKRMKLIVE